MTMKTALLSTSLLAGLMLISAPASALCVKVSEANLRQGPGTQYEKSWEVYAYMPFRELSRQGDWYKVADVDGDQHWIHGNLVSKSLRCAVVKKPKANVRTGPGTRYSLSDLGSVEKYYSFKVLEERGGWVKVEDDVDNVGWMAGSLLWMPPKR